MRRSARKRTVGQRQQLNDEELEEAEDPAGPSIHVREQSAVLAGGPLPAADPYIGGMDPLETHDSSSPSSSPAADSGPRIEDLEDNDDFEQPSPPPKKSRRTSSRKVKPKSKNSPVPKPAGKPSKSSTGGTGGSLSSKSGAKAGSSAIPSATQQKGKNIFLINNNFFQFSASFEIPCRFKCKLRSEVVILNYKTLNESN